MTLPLAVLRESPRSATILIQLDCNARCPFCSTRVYTEQGVLAPVDFRQGVVRPAKEYTLSTEAIRAHLDALRAEGVEKVNLQGGEPTLHPGLLELLRYGRTIGFREQTIVSNGRTLKDAAFVQALVEAGVDTIVLSIFGPAAAVHDASLGVRGAFDDLSAGVDALVAARRAGARLTVMAQVTLHADNVEALPETVRHWYGRGLRDFSFRLLRETDNTRRAEPGRWFFDPARLRGPLSEALAFCRAKGDAIVTLGEIFYCAVPPDLLGFVLRDVGANPTLRGAKVQIAKHFEASFDGGAGRAAGREQACAGCDFEGICVRPEAPYRAAFSGRFEPRSVAAVVRSLVAAPLGHARVDEALHLLGTEARLGWFGVPDEDRLALRGRVSAELDGDGRLAEVVLGDRGRKELLDRLRKNGRRPVVVRLIPISEFGASGPLDGRPEEVLARLEAACPAERRPALDFVRKAGVLANEPLVLSCVYVRRSQAGEQFVVAALFDDRHLDGARLARAVDGLVKATSPAA